MYIFTRTYIHTHTHTHIYIYIYTKLAPKLTATASVAQSVKCWSRDPGSRVQFPAGGLGVAFSATSPDLPYFKNHLSIYALCAWEEIMQYGVGNGVGKGSKEALLFWRLENFILTFNIFAKYSVLSYSYITYWSKQVNLQFSPIILPYRRAWARREIKRGKTEAICTDLSRYYIKFVYIYVFSTCLCLCVKIRYFTMLFIHYLSLYIAALALLSGIFYFVYKSHKKKKTIRNVLGKEKY